VKSKRFQAVTYGQWFDFLESALRFIALLQSVIWDERPHMMDIVKAYVSGEPLEYLWQPVKRASFECGSQPTPVVLSRPVRAFEVVLDIE
jgi:hypothetical protein